MLPRAANVQRQPHWRIITSVSGTAIMPPIREPRNITPFAVPRSCAGNQRENARAMFGNAPASPAPNRNRTARSVPNPRTAPVSIVNADHHSTMRVRTRRGPYTSPNHPDGTSKSE